MPPTADLATDLFARLVAVETTSSLSNLAAVTLLEETLSRPGVALRRYPSPDGSKANLWVRLGPALEPGDRRGLVLSGHTDCVPAGESGWTGDPFHLADRGDRWVGRGSADMKGFLALAAAFAATVDPARLRLPLGILFTYDEEVGMLGAREFLRARPEDEPLPRAWVIGEPTSLAVARMHKGHWKLRVTLAGRTAHSGTPQHGVNAIEKAAPLITALADLRRELARERPPLGEFFPEAPFVPLNVARIEGGVAINVVPDRCAIELGFRPLPGSDPAEVERRVVERVRSAAPGATLEKVGVSEPLLTSESSPLHRALCALVGQRKSRGAPFSTDAGPLSTLDLDAVVWGPGSIEVAHRPDEWMPKADFARCAELLPALVDRFCGPGSDA
jgi:acetylornithine deacetylase